MMSASKNKHDDSSPGNHLSSSRGKCGYRGCERDAYNSTGPSGKPACLFHAFQKPIDNFWKALGQLIESWREQPPAYWNFSGFVFPGPVDVHSLTSLTSSDNKIQFPCSVLFRNACFQQGVNLSSATFLRYVSFENATFMGETHFASTDFAAQVNFGHARFEKNAYFTRSAFRRHAIFCETRFAAASFEESEFHDIADFSLGEFTGNVSFALCVFDSDATFAARAFGKRADFRDVTFRRHSNFVECAFGNRVLFDRCSFAHLGNFTSCRIHGTVEWQWPGEGLRFCDTDRSASRGIILLRSLRFDDDGVLDLSYNYLHDDSTLRIEYCDMARVRLAGTDCRKISFFGNKWPEVSDSLIGKWFPFPRLAIGDEALDDSLKGVKLRDALKERTMPRWHTYQVTYQQLSSRFRDDFAHQLANDFERGTFEMRRLHHRFHAGWRTRKEMRHLWNWWLVAFYKYVSHYSGSIFLPVLWLIIILLAASFIYHFALYQGTVDVRLILLPSQWNLDGLRSALRVSVLDRSWFGDIVQRSGLSSWGKALVQLSSVVQSILMATTVTLFIFAVRRRFRH